MAGNLQFNVTSDALILNEASLVEYPVLTAGKEVEVYYLEDMLSDSFNNIPYNYTVDDYQTIKKNSIVIGDDTIDGFFAEIPVCAELSDDQLLHSRYYPLGDSLKGVPLKYYKYSNNPYGAVNSSVDSNLSSQVNSLVSDRRLTKQGIGNIGCYNSSSAVSSNIRNIAYMPDTSNSWKEYLYSNNISGNNGSKQDGTFYYAASFTDLTPLNSNLVLSQDGFSIKKLNDKTFAVLRIPVVIQEPGVYSASLYVKSSVNITVHGPCLEASNAKYLKPDDSGKIEGISVIANKTTAIKDRSLVGISPSTSTLVEDRLLSNFTSSISSNWVRVYSSFDIPSVPEEGLSAYMTFLVSSASAIVSIAGVCLERLADSLNSTVTDVTTIYKPSPYVNKYVKYFKDETIYDYPLMFSFPSFSTQGNRWIITYKRLFNTTAAANTLHFDTLGANLTVGYQGSKLAINLDNANFKANIQQYSENDSITTDDFYNSWEQVFIYPEDSKIAIESYSTDSNAHYKVLSSAFVTEQDMRSTLIEDTPGSADGLHINLMLGGRARYNNGSIDINYSNGYYRDLIYLYSIEADEFLSTLNILKHRFLALNKQSITALDESNNIVEKEGLLLFSNNLFEKGDNL